MTSYKHCLVPFSEISGFSGTFLYMNLQNLDSLDSPSEHWFKSNKKIII